MNCTDSLAVLSDLASDRMMDAGLRQAALSHTESCEGCARWLEDARSLKVGLERIAASDAGKEAPAQLEAALVAAFNERHSESSFPRASGRGASRRWLYVAAGIAAAAAMAALISLVASRTQGSGPVAPKEAHSTNPAPALLESPPPGPAPEKQVATSDSNNKNRRGEAVKRAGRAARIARDPIDRDIEIATDFFPLVNRESLAQLDSAQLVRVELPRTALMSFGLPVDMDRTGERVKADVVVGQDGLARAIRFVR